MAEPEDNVERVTLQQLGEAAKLFGQVQQAYEDAQRHEEACQQALKQAEKDASAAYIYFSEARARFGKTLRWYAGVTGDPEELI